MHRLPFIPARNSRHRAAALSLYRALLRSADKIGFPEELRSLYPRSSIRHTIKRRFMNNRPYTSLRLVYASMAAGYKFLSMFVKAQSPASPEYSQLIAHLRPRLSCPSIRVKSPPRTTPITQKPFLVNISKDDTPQYAPTYNLTSKTRTPRLCATADGQPFIRLKKPQPVALSKMIGRKGRLFQKKIMKVVEVDEELATAAALEDQWDDLIAAQMRREGISTKENDAIARERPSPNSFSWSVQLTRLWWEWQIERSWQDWVARGEALNRFVGERKGLDKEARTGLATSPGGGSTNSKRPLWNHSEPPNVGVHPTAPFPLLAAIKAQIGNSQAPSGKVIDPFLEVRWNALVEAEKGRLLRWIARNAANFNGSS